MKTIDSAEYLMILFAVGLFIWPSSKLPNQKIFLIGVILYGLGVFFSLFDYSSAADIYFKLAILCLLISCIKAALKYKNGK